MSLAGYSLAPHQFWAENVREWTIEAPADALLLCLNTAGYGCAHHAGKTLDLTAGTGAYFLGGAFSGHRAQGEMHRFTTLVVAAELWMPRLLPHAGSLKPGFSLANRLAPASGFFSKTVAIDKLARQLLRPPVADAARSLWIESKISEILCDIAFAPNEEPFCARYQRVTQERVQQTVAILRQHLSDPPNLAEIGRQVGCSPFHLSRIFSAETGRTIPQFVRQLRMERASELLQSGAYNVTETAFEIGYSSLSHFSKSYFETFGVSPKDGSRLAG